MNPTVRCVVIIMSIVLLFGCSSREKGYSTPEEALEKSNIPYTQILHKVDREDFVLLFYEAEQPHNIGLGYVKKENSRWYWGMGFGNAYNSGEPVTYSWSNLDQLVGEGTGNHIFWGTLRDPNIVRFHVQYNNGWSGLDSDAELLDTEWGYRIWYVLAREYHGTVPGVNGTGYGKNGEIIYQNY